VRNPPFWQLGSLAPKVAPQELLQAAAQSADLRATAIRQIGHHRIVLVAAQRLEDLMREGDTRAESLHDGLRSQVSSMKQRLSVLERARLLCRQWAAEQEVRLGEIKGLAVSAMYESASRDMNDIDVMVRTVDEAWSLTAYLRRAGYGYYPYELPWLKRWQGDWLYGQVTMSAVDSGEEVRIDIHFGGYCVRHCGLLVPSVSGSAGGATPNTADALILLANNAHDACVRQKDLNDFYLLTLKSGPSVDWHEFRTHAEQTGIGPYWRSLRRALEESMDLTGEQRSALAASADIEGKDEGTLPFGRYEWKHRRAIIVRHSYLLGRPNSIASWRNAITAFLQYRRPRRVRAVRIFGSAGGCVRKLSPGRCVRLVPQHGTETESGGDLTAQRPIPGTTLLRVRRIRLRTYVESDFGDRFSPTVFQRLVGRGQPVRLPYGHDPEP
jgi:hypothetical protein